MVESRWRQWMRKHRYWLRPRNETCPISLNTMQEARTVFRVLSEPTNPMHQAQCHWFDGDQLARNMVVHGDFLNPLTRTQFSPYDLLRLDRLIEEGGGEEESNDDPLPYSTFTRRYFPRCIHYDYACYTYKQGLEECADEFSDCIMFARQVTIHAHEEPNYLQTLMNVSQRVLTVFWKFVAHSHVEANAALIATVRALRNDTEIYETTHLYFLAVLDSLLQESCSPACRNRRGAEPAPLNAQCIPRSIHVSHAQRIAWVRHCHAFQQNRSEQNQSEQNQSEQNQSEQNQSEQNQSTSTEYTESDIDLESASDADIEYEDDGDDEYYQRERERVAPPMSYHSQDYETDIDDDEYSIASSLEAYLSSSTSPSSNSPLSSPTLPLSTHTTLSSPLSNPIALCSSPRSSLMNRATLSEEKEMTSDPFNLDSMTRFFSQLEHDK